uniref:Uncharacterized protein n=1 Tax=Solanum lycopersicum TaxID=4081 RepID=A0A3Q7E9N2_SOLLC
MDYNLIRKHWTQYFKTSQKRSYGMRVEIVVKCLTFSLTSKIFDNMNYAGPLPSSICNMSWLGFLDLSHNNFSNSISSCLRSMASLRVLDLRRNNFTESLSPLCVLSTDFLEW